VIRVERWILPPPVSLSKSAAPELDECGSKDGWWKYYRIPQKSRLPFDPPSLRFVEAGSLRETSEDIEI